MKFSVSSYSFQRLLSAGTMTQFDCISKAAEMGFDAIEFVGILPHDGSTREEYAAKLREECRRCGLEVSNYTIAADLLNGCDGDLDAEVKRLQGEVDIAVILGAPGMRHDAAWGTQPYRSFTSVLPRLAEGCRRVTEYAAEKGVRTMVENHGFFCQDSDRMERLVQAVDHPNFGLLCDMGNFLCVDEDPVHALSLAAPYAVYAHAKDFLVKSGNGEDPGQGFFTSRGGNYLRGTIIGHGAVPVRQCLRILKQAGYDGTVAIEFEGPEDVLEGISIGLENLRRYVQGL